MDNDNILLQKAADIYRGLRFKMKYRGVDILPAGAGNDLVWPLRRDRNAHRGRLFAERRQRF